MRTDPMVDITSPAPPAADAARRSHRKHRIAVGMVGPIAAAVLLLVMAGSVALAKPSAAPRGFLTVSGLTTSAAGTAQAITVTAVKNGKTDTGYRGTVVITSTDAQAVLPTSYTFTSKDKGVHAFSVTLKTAGSQTLTATDADIIAMTGSQTGTVSAGPAAAFSLSGLVAATAGSSQSVTLTIHDEFGNVAPSYRGTVAFSSNDPQAELPANHAFTAGDAGSRSFDVVLKTSGELQQVTATDAAIAALTSSQTAAISSGPAADLILATDLSVTLGSQGVATAGQPFSVVLTAVDQFGNRATGYAGQVDLASTDVLTELPGGTSGHGSVQFGPSDAGRVTLPGVALFDKQIYNQHATLSAVDASDGGIAAATNVQVLPGPVVAYDCGQPLSVASGYQTVKDPIGVNDAIGLGVTAVDEFGNNATNRQPAIAIGPRHPFGYEADATVQTSDTQAVFGPPGQLARFTASNLFIGTPITVSLRTAGQQTLTITDPDNPSLTATCLYEVEGPRAFTGTIDVADPNTTGNTIVNLPAFSYLPPNDSGYTITNLSGPQANSPVGLLPLGTVGAISAGNLPAVAWNTDPPAPPPGTLTCATESVCVVAGPLQITYTLLDVYGNASNGTITIKPWNALLRPGNMLFSGDGVIVGASNAVVALNTTHAGTVIGVGPGTATIQIGTDTAMNIAIPGGSSLSLGSQVSVILQQPLVVDGTAQPCAPAPGISCHVSGLVAVTVIPVNPEEPPPNQAPLTGLQTMGTDMCGFFGGVNTCPSIGYKLLLPPLGVGMPPPGEVNEFYPTPEAPYRLVAESTVDEELTFKVLVPEVPPGVTLLEDGRFVGIPTKAGIFTFTVQVTGKTSGAYRVDLFTIRIDP